MKPQYEPEIEFQGRGAGAGSIGGVLLATGVPFVVLRYGDMLGQETQKWLVIGTVITGCLMAIGSAMLGLVMPSHIYGSHPRGPSLRETAEDSPKLADK